MSCNEQVQRGMVHSPGTITANLRLHAERRIVDVTVGAAGLQLRLPDANLFNRVGGIVYYVVSRSGSTNSAAITDKDGNAVLGNGTLAIGGGSLVYLHDRATQKWFALPINVVTKGQDLPLVSYSATFNLTQNVYNFQLDVESRKLGWDGVMPLSAVVRVNFGVVIGGEASFALNQFAFKTGVLPAASNLLFVNLGQVCGKGGDGGYGSVPPLHLPNEDGEDGGHAMELRCATVIANWGLIQGAGGGGGGGASSGSGPTGRGGGGGGGGAGARAGQGGPGQFGGSSGGAGGLNFGGAGGQNGGGSATNGGPGGGAATAGTAAFGAGGAAGKAIRTLAAHHPPTFIATVGGSIVGAQESF